MINEKRTLKDFEYTSDTLSHGSNKRVWRVCEGCGKEDKVIYQSYIHGYKKCALCGGANTITSKRGPFDIEYFNTVQKSINDGYINEIKTFNTFKYYSIDLSYGSGKKIWRICEKCGEESEVIYKDYIGGYTKCKSCVRTGKPLSDATKKKISKSHKGKTITEEARRRLSAMRQNIPYSEWTSYAIDSPYCANFNDECRETNREKYDRRCFLCNRHEEDNIDRNGNKHKLSVHHVDMNKNQGCDGHEWKLVPLCMWCHGPGHIKKIISCIEYILKN